MSKCRLQSEIDELLEAVEDGEVRELLLELYDNRIDNKNPITPRGMRALIRRMNKISAKPEVQRAMIEKAITSNWATVWPLTETELTNLSTHLDMAGYNVTRLTERFNQF